MSQSIMIVGAGPGIGQAVAQKFGREGWAIVLSGRNEKRLDAQANELRDAGITAHGVRADATKPEEIRAAMAEADRLTRGLSAVLYNAAAVRMQDLFSMTDEEVTDELAINVAGGLHTIRSAVPMLRGRGGTILVTGGGLAVSPHASYASLGAGKAALRNIVQALAEPLARQNIRIATVTVATLVSPGSVEARGVAETLWALANEPRSAWEARFPAA